MPRDSNGNFSLIPSYLATTGQDIVTSQHNPVFEDVAAAITGSLPRNGAAPMGANLSMGGFKAVNMANGTAPTDAVTLAQVQEMLRQRGAITGELKIITGALVPTGYIRANGQSVLRAIFPDLWEYAQTSGNLSATQEAKTSGQYGPGDGSTTFTVPNIVDFIRGLDPDRAIGSSQADELKGHGHTATFTGAPVAPHQHSYASAPGGGGSDFGGGIQAASLGFTGLSGGFTPSGTVSVAASTGAETRPKNIAYPYVIKT